MDITKELLQKLYWDNGLSTRDIAKEIGCSQPTVRCKMIKFGIPRRTYKDNPMPVKKGQSLPKHHRDAISKAQKQLIAEGKRVYGGSNNPSWKGGKATVYCAICGISIKVIPARLKKTKLFFCNKEHFAQWQSERMKGERTEYVDVSCSHCGKILHIRKKRLEKSRSGRLFCSPQHQANWRKTHLRGENSWNWKGGYEPYYGPNWEEQRRNTLERDDYTCQVCGNIEIEERELSAHHIIPFREFGRERYKEANHLFNLLTVCNSCHGQLHPR